LKPVGAKLTTIVHATEDAGKVSTALDNVCPIHIFEQKTETRKLKGHYGNEITTLTVTLRKRSVEPFLQHLMGQFPREEIGVLIHDLDNRIDEDGHLYLRLDKQECLQGRIRLVEQDPVKCELSFEIDKAERSPLTHQIGQYFRSTLG